MPWQRLGATRLGQGQRQQPSSRLTSALVKRIMENPEDAERILGRRGLDPDEAREFIERERDPGTLAKVLGPLDILGAGARASSHNMVLRMQENRDKGDVLGNMLLGAGPIGMLAANTIAKPTEGSVNVLAEMGKSATGHTMDTVDTRETMRQLSARTSETWDDEFTESGWGAAAGLAGDVLNDPLNFITGGTASITKAAQANKLRKLATGGITAEKLTEAGIDVAAFVARHADEFGGADKLNEALKVGLRTAGTLKGAPAVTKAMTEDIWREAGKAAARELAGSQAKVGVPLLYRVGDKAQLDQAAQLISKGEKALAAAGDDVAAAAAQKLIDEGTALYKAANAGAPVKAGGWYPSFKKIAKTPGEGTILERIGLEPTVGFMGEAAKTGTRVDLMLPWTRQVDSGGIKFLGETIKGTDDFAVFLGTKLRAAKYSDTPIASVYRQLSGLFNRYAIIDAQNNRLLSALARGSSGSFDARRSLARQLAIEEGIDIGGKVDDREAHLLGLLIEDVWTPEEWSELNKLFGQIDTFDKDTASILKRVNADIDSIPEVRGAKAERAANANMKLEELGTRREILLEEQAEILEAISEAGLDARTAEASRAVREYSRGRGKGTGDALREAQRAVKDATDDLERFVARGEKEAGRAEDILSGLGKKAQPASVAPAVADDLPVTPRTAPVTAPTPPADVDTYITRNFGDMTEGVDTSEAAEWLRSHTKAYFKQHAFEPGQPLSEEILGAFTEAGLRKSDIFPATTKRFTESVIEAAYERGFGELLFPGMRGTAELPMADTDILNVVADTLASRGATKLTPAQAVDRIGIDAVLDDLRRNIEAAWQSGDTRAAEQWTKVANDFADALEAPVIDPIMGDVISEGAKVGRPWAGEATPAVKKPPSIAGEYEDVIATTKKADIAAKRKAEADRIRKLVSDAKAKGRVQGHQAASRTALRDSVRAERKLAAAEGRKARYAGIIMDSSDDAEIADAAYSALKSIERELAGIGKQNIRWMERFKRGTAEYQPIDRMLTRLAANQEQATALRLQLSEIVRRGNVDRIEQALVAQGVTPERARELRGIVESIQEQNEHWIRERQRVQFAQPWLVSEEAGSLGFVGHSNPTGDNFLDSMRRRVGKPTEQQRVRREAVRDVMGVDFDELETIAPRYESVQQRSIRPDMDEKRTIRTMREKMAPTDIDPDTGLPRVGQKLETDIRVAHPKHVRNEMEQIAKVRFEDEVYSSVGVLKRGKGTPKGYVARPVTRDGKTVEYLIPDYVGAWIDTYEKLLVNDESLNALLRGYDRVHNFLKRMMTSWNPRFHVRNFGSNYFMAFAHDLHDPGAWEDGYKALSAVGAGRGDEVLIKLGDDTVVTATELVARTKGTVLRGQMGHADVGIVVPRAVRSETPNRNILSELGRELNPSNVGSAAGQFIEDGARLSGYIAASRKGMTHEAAASMADRVFYNYMPESMTRAEREGFKRVIPFYAWLKQNIPTMLEQMSKNPSKINWLTRLRNTMFDEADIDPSLLPDWMRKMYYMPTGMRDSNDTPIMFNPSVIPVGDVGRLFGGPSEFVSAVSPIAGKTEAEIFANFDSWQERPVAAYEGETKRAPGYMQVIERTLGGTEWWESTKENLGIATKQEFDDPDKTFIAIDAKLAKRLRDYLPFFESIGKLMDDRERSGYDRLNYLGAASVSPLDEDVYSGEQVRRMQSIIDDLMRKKRAEGKL